MRESGAISAELVAALLRRFERRWEIRQVDGKLSMFPRRRVKAQPSAEVPPVRDTLTAMGRVFAKNGVLRPPLLPVRWGRDTDLLVSGVQALDPWLKNGEDRVWREGFLPQPVVRFTGERDDQGHLKDGFLTSFVNLSCVLRLRDVHRFADLLDVWFDVLSAVGIHAGRLDIAGDLRVWERGPVSGITLHIADSGVGFADAILLWHTAEPHRLAIDIGSGLERLRWRTSPLPWPETTFGNLANSLDTDVLDAVRTATLLVMSGIQPGAQSAGSALRRVCRRIPTILAASGLGRLVAASRAHWAEVGVAGPASPNLAAVIEREVLRRKG